MVCKVEFSSRGSGFQSSNADSSLFVRSGSTGKVVVLIYVDDLIVTSDSANEINNLKWYLKQKLAIKDLGVLKYFLGIEMATSHKRLFSNQRKYALDFLQESGMLDSKPARTLLDSKLKLDMEGELLNDIRYYQRTYLLNYHQTRHHICRSVGRGILMKNNDNVHILGYTDVDWAGNCLDRKSTTGYCAFIGGNLVTWKSKKQQVIARSSAEAEYRAMASTACELIWLKGLLSDLGFYHNQSMLLFCDNQAALHIASNPVFHERTKHIEVDCHYIRAHVQSKVIQTQYTQSYDQLAYIFTKALPTTQFQWLLSKLGSINPLDPA
ncbi:hypothetical protein L3X38_007864 [Prunus dulcis]|uniref:Reverse transcriptase Ty1/copia-type domain-containing protein n=1 Tax=Prunus dulcis TaxID=3755 RepID=A0AAD4ZVK0_PRUDU|nr:hypothetical protein L3X38_007864 [Prunus dulcis]